MALPCTNRRLLNPSGIASICALLVVFSAPEIRHDIRHLLPTRVGFALPGACYYKTRSIIFSTLLSASGYGFAWKLMMFL